MNTRTEILQTAEKLINGDRQEEYGTPQQNFQRIAVLWNTWLEVSRPDRNVSLSPQDVATMMLLLKLARSVQSPKMDTFIDAAGYIAIAGELAGAKS